MGGFWGGGGWALGWARGEVGDRLGPAVIPDLNLHLWTAESSWLPQFALLSSLLKSPAMATHAKRHGSRGMDHEREELGES